jgi:DNA-binding XRE family transcriptional regulator
MNKDWLWDRKITLQKAKNILRNPEHPKFIELSALLLIRKYSPQEVFPQYLSPAIFCQNWGAIKRIMRKDAWGSPRLLFWQAVYEKVKEKLLKKGKEIKPAPLSKADEFCKAIGQKIKLLRKERGFTQNGLAKSLRVSQQIISRIERGRQNISLLTLKNIASVLKAKADFILQ